MKEVKGQVSIEYLLVLSLALLLLLPGGYLFYSFSQGSQDEVIASQIHTGIIEVINSIEEMYAVGQNSWTTVTINFPGVVRNMYVVNNEEIVVEYDGSNGISHAVFFSRINITTPFGGNVSSAFTPGLTKIRVSSMGPYIVLSEVT